LKPRLRRLVADYQRIQKDFAEHAYIRLREAEGNPPERYVFQLSLAGLVPDGEAGHCPGTEHTVEAFLSKDYPRRPPICRMLSPVFHPNISPQKICIGDHWSADQSLAHLVIRIGEMICFQSYNIKSPLNAVAAAWAEMNAHQLPLFSGDLMPRSDI